MLLPLFHYFVHEYLTKLVETKILFVGKVISKPQTKYELKLNFNCIKKFLRFYEYFPLFIISFIIEYCINIVLLIMFC